jgi:para-nitrobenzyl esterase
MNASPANAPVTSAAQLQVHVSDGWLRGTVSQGAREFLGVPYAAPPVRFAPPQPARPWPAVTADAHPVLGLRPTGNSVSTSFTAAHQCAFWSGVFR